MYPRVLITALFLMPLTQVVLAQGQPAAKVETPPGMEELSGDVLLKRLSGKSFKGTTADGKYLRVQYNEGGAAYLNVGDFNDGGKWRVDGTQVCTEWRRAPSSCSEIRFKGEVAYFRRNATGEFIEYKPD